MGWEDRDYYKEGRGGHDDPVFSLLRWSMSLGTYWRIDIRLHLFFIVQVVVYLLIALFSRFGSVTATMRWLALLFVSVLLHELGHAFACRAVGGHANEVVLVPWGGFARCHPPNRPWPSLITTACGPLVNLVIAVASYFAMRSLLQNYPEGFNLSTMFGPAKTAVWWYGVLAELYGINVLLLILNVLLLCMPFDGGCMLQEVLWMFFGWGRSMLYACRFGLVFCVVVGLACLAFGMTLFLITLGFGFYYSYQTLVMLPMLEEQRRFGYEFGGDDLWQADTIKPKKSSWFARHRAKRAADRLERERRLAADADKEVDRILAKVKAEGLHSLTDREKNTLRRDTDRRNRAG